MNRRMPNGTFVWEDGGSNPASDPIVRALDTLYSGHQSTAAELQRPFMQQIDRSKLVEQKFG
jgi:hypothetical protein